MLFLTRLCTIFGRRFQREANSSVMNFEGMGFFTLPEEFITLEEASLGS